VSFYIPFLPEYPWVMATTEAIPYDQKHVRVYPLPGQKARCEYCHQWRVLITKDGEAIHECPGCGAGLPYPVFTDTIITA